MLDKNLKKALMGSGSDLFTTGSGKIGPDPPNWFLYSKFSICTVNLATDDRTWKVISKVSMLKMHQMREMHLMHKDHVCISGLRLRIIFQMNNCSKGSAFCLLEFQQKG